LLVDYTIDGDPIAPQPKSDRATSAGRGCVYPYFALPLAELLDQLTRSET
jgi:hypothetical protein